MANRSIFAALSVVITRLVLLLTGSKLACPSNALIIVTRAAVDAGEAWLTEKVTKGICTNSQSQNACPTATIIILSARFKSLSAWRTSFPNADASTTLVATAAILIQLLTWDTALVIITFEGSAAKLV